jgi:hypothetical protein
MHARVARRDRDLGGDLRGERLQRVPVVGHVEPDVDDGGARLRVAGLERAPGRAQAVELQVDRRGVEREPLPGQFDGDRTGQRLGERRAHRGRRVGQREARDVDARRGDPGGDAWLSPRRRRADQEQGDGEQGDPAAHGSRA